jgi:hypothetical protein
MVEGAGISAARRNLVDAIIVARGAVAAGTGSGTELCCPLDDRQDGGLRPTSVWKRTARFAVEVTTPDLRARGGATRG